MSRIPLVLCILSAVALTAQVPAGTSADPFVRGSAVPEGAVAIVAGHTVSRDEFVSELVNHFLRPNAAGHAVLEAQERELLIGSAAASRAFTASEEEIDQRIAGIETQMKPTGRTLEDMLKERKVSMPAFRAKTRSLVLLEKLARDELKIPADKPIENFHCNLWLKQATDSSPVVRDAAKLPKSAVSSIGEHVITAEMFAKELVLSAPPDDVVKVAEILVQLRLAEKLLSEAKLELTPADLQAEWDWHAAEFERDPSHGGVSYAEVIRQTQGISREEFMAARAFRTRAILSKLTAARYDAERLKQEYESHAALFGPILELRHLLIRCSDDPAARGKLPTLAEGEAKLKGVLAQMDTGVSLADIARLHSDDLNTKAKGGLMAPITPGRYTGPRELVETALKLEPGAMSAPFTTASGWHILLLVKRSPAPPLESARIELLQELGRELFRAEWQRADIGINLHLR